MCLGGMYSWRGPCRVTAKLSATSYRVEHVQTGRKYTRSIMNVSKWQGNTIDVPVDADGDSQIRLDDFQINDLIAVLDDAGDTEWHLARVTDIVDGHLEVHYFGTSGRALSSAKFRPVYIDDGDQRPLLRSNGLRHNERAHHLGQDAFPSRPILSSWTRWRCAPMGDSPQPRRARSKRSSI